MRTIILTLVLSLGCTVMQAQTTPPASTPDSASSPAPDVPSDEAQKAALRQALHDTLSGKANAANAQNSRLFAQSNPQTQPATPAPRPIPGPPPASAAAANASTSNVPGLPAIPSPAQTQPAVSNPPPIIIPASPLPVPGATGRPAAGAANPAPATAPPSATQPATAPGIVPGSQVGSPNENFVAIPPAGGGTAPQEEPIPPGIINFPNTELNQVLPFYAKLVNRTILRPTSLPTPNITLVTQTLLTQKEAIQAFDAVFALNGITMVNVGDKFVKMVPEQQVFSTGAAFDNLEPSQLPELGQFVTHVVQLKYVKPTDMVAVLQPFMKIPNAILPIDASQILVLRDYTENVKRMLEMIARVDVSIPSDFDSEVIPIKYAKASDIANVLNTLSAGGGGGTTVGGGGSSRGSLRTTGGGSGYRGGTGFGSGGTGFPGSTTGFGTPGSPYGNPTPQATTTPGAAQSPQSSFTSRLQNIISRASGVGEFQILGETKMIADERTNSLLIYATKKDMKTIKEIISKLDVVLAQVEIESVIIEVDLNKSQDLGVSYVEQQFHPGGSSYFQGRGALINSLLLNQGSFNSATNLAGALPGGFSYLASLGNDVDITLKAVAGNDVAKVIQRPTIQTSHNEPASLFVGESRPYPSGSYYGGGSFGGYSSIQAVNIGVTLEVTPLINPDGLVVMEIHQTIESVSGSVNIANVGDVPVTSRKDASTKVSVRDRETIVVGGLIETSKSRSLSGIPILMNVPVLGYLFRSTSDVNNRTELIVLLRPTVLKTPEIAAANAKEITDRLPGVRKVKEEMQAEERRMRQLNSQKPLDN